MMRHLPRGLASFAFQGGAALACRLPEPLARGTGRWVGFLCWALQGHRRSIITRNLAWLGPARNAGGRARATFGYFGESVVDTLRLARLEPAEVSRRVRVEGAEGLRRALAQGGAVLLAAHAGNWEWAGAALSERGFPVTAAARRLSRESESFFGRLRERFGVRAGPQAAAELRSTRSRLVVLFCDRARNSGEDASPRRAARGAVALAARRGWGLFPAVALRERNGYRLVIGDSLRPGREQAGRRLAARSALAFLHRELARQPEQWFAFEPIDSAGRASGLR